MARTYNKNRDRWYDEYNDEEGATEKKYFNDRRREKRVRSALRSKNIDDLIKYDEED